jgi:hypothetical protein
MLRQVNMILLPDFLTPVTRRIARLVLSRRPFKQPCNVGEAPEPLRSNLTRADGEGGRTLAKRLTANPIARMEFAGRARHRAPDGNVPRANSLAC